MSASADLHLTPELIIRAYRQGLFPMADAVDDPETFWVDPQMRGVMPLEDFHVPRRLVRTIKRAPFDMRINTNFRQTIEACRTASADRPTSWINDDILSAYCKLHAMGHAHSVECWSEERLVGGLYGVCIAGAFFGESMFSRRRDASKLALAHLVDHLRNCGFALFDTQFITPHLQTLGAIEISRAAYHRLLEEALERPADISAQPLCQDTHSVLQRITQTS